MRKYKQITLVVVTYNSHVCIDKLLKSISSYDRTISRVIILDNNSRDVIELGRVINKHKKRGIKIKFIKNNENIGFARACNIGAKISTTKYVLFLNPDTILNDKTLETIHKHAENNNADLIGGKCLDSKGKIHRTVVRKLDITAGIFELTNVGKILLTNIGERHFYQDVNDYCESKDLSVGGISGAFLLVNLKSYNILGGFDEKFFMYLEDVDLGYRANKKGMKVLYCPHSYIYHLGGSSSNNVYQINHEAWYESRRHYFYKNTSVLTNILIQPIFFIEEIILRARLKYVHKTSSRVTR